MPRARTIWEEGTRAGRQMVRLGVATCVVLALLDIAIWREVGWIFDIGFVVLCVAIALLVRPADFYTVAVLPPLLMIGLFAVLGMLAPGTIAKPDDGLLQALISGLAHHAGALAAGYGLLLLCLLQRRRVLRMRGAIV